MACSSKSAVVALLAEGRRFVLTTHMSPDGDGIGSQLALAALLRSRGARVEIVNADPLPRLLEFLDPRGEIEVFEAGRHEAVIEAADSIVMLDNSVPSRMGSMEAAVRRSSGKKICIDHHPEPDDYWDTLFVDVTACCTGELVFDLFREFGQSVDPQTAGALYTALVSDTGRFRFGNTTPRALHMAGDLVAAGASPPEIYGRLEEQHSEGFLRMYGEVLSKMETRCSGRLLVLRIPKVLIERHDAEREDLSEIINQSLGHRESRLAALFRELEGGSTKVSLRSKGSRDVNRLARLHGGGGHPNASGIVLDQPMEEAIRRLLPELEQLAAEPD